MDEDEKKQIRIIVIAIVIGTTTLNQGLQEIFPLRHDPYTGEEASYAKQQYDRRVGDLERELLALRASLAANREEDARYRALDEERIRNIVERIAEIRSKQKEREDRERGDYGKR